MPIRQMVIFGPAVLCKSYVTTRSTISIPSGWDASLSQGYPIINFAGTHLYNCVERGTVRVKSLVQEHDTVFPARIQTEPLDLEASTLTMRPLREPIRILHITADYYNRVYLTYQVNLWNKMPKLCNPGRQVYSNKSRNFPHRHVQEHASSFLSGLVRSFLVT